MDMRKCTVSHTQYPEGGYKEYFAGKDYDVTGMDEATVKAYFSAEAGNGGSDQSGEEGKRGSAEVTATEEAKDNGAALRQAQGDPKDIDIVNKSTQRKGGKDR